MQVRESQKIDHEAPHHQVGQHRNCGLAPVRLKAPSTHHVQQQITDVGELVCKKENAYSGSGQREPCESRMVGMEIDALVCEPAPQKIPNARRCGDQSCKKKDIA